MNISRTESARAWLKGLRGQYPAIARELGVSRFTIAHFARGVHRYLRADILDGVMELKGRHDEGLLLLGQQATVTQPRDGGEC